MMEEKKDRYAILFYTGFKYEGKLTKTSEKFYFLDDIKDGSLQVPIHGCVLKEISKEQYETDLNRGKPDTVAINKQVKALKDKRKAEAEALAVKYPGMNKSQIWNQQQCEKVNAEKEEKRKHSDKDFAESMRVEE